MKYILTILCFTVATTFATLEWKPVYMEKKIVSEKERLQIVEASPKAPIVKPKDERKILVYSATGGFRHWNIPVAKIAFNEMGKSSGAFEAVVSDDPDNFEPDVLKTFDAVVLVNTTGNFFMPCTHGDNNVRDQFSDEEWAELQVRDKRLLGNLVDYVHHGGGLVGIHAAADAYYGNWDYRNMLGGTFMGHPWHGNQQAVIRIDEPQHPLMAPVFGDLTEISFKEEIFQYNDPYSRDRLRILMTLDVEKTEKPKGEPKREDGDYAIAWIHEVGAGRVFYTAIGHNYSMYWNPQILNHYLAGIQYATGDLEADATPSSKR